VLAIIIPVPKSHEVVSPSLWLQFFWVPGWLLCTNIDVTTPRSAGTMLGLTDSVCPWVPAWQGELHN
jgi:hypothetical protein